MNAVVAVGVTFTSGIEPGAYVGSMPAMSTAMAAIFAGLLALVGWLQLKPEVAVVSDGARDLLKWPI